MNDLNKRALGGLLKLLVVLAASLFIPAWTLDYWQAWLFLSVIGVAVLAITLYLMENDPKLAYSDDVDHSVQSDVDHDSNLMAISVPN